jgi:hypothetical protein
MRSRRLRLGADTVAKKACGRLSRSRELRVGGVPGNKAPRRRRRETRRYKIKGEDADLKVGHYKSDDSCHECA